MSWRGGSQTLPGAGASYFDDARGLKKKKGPLKQAAKYAPVAAAAALLLLITTATIFASKLGSNNAKLRDLGAELEKVRADYFRQKHLADAHQTVLDSRSHEAERLRKDIRTHTATAEGLRHDLKQAQDQLAAKEEELKRTKDEVHAMDGLLQEEKQRSGHASVCSEDLQAAHTRANELTRQLAEKQAAVVDLERRLAADTAYHYQKERDWEAARLTLEKDLEAAKCDHPDHQDDPKPAAGQAGGHSHAHGSSTDHAADSHGHSHDPTASGAGQSPPAQAADGGTSSAGDPNTPVSNPSQEPLPEAQPAFTLMATLLEDEGVFHHEGHSHMARLLTKTLAGRAAQQAHPGNLNTGTPLLDEGVAKSLADAGVRDRAGLPHLITALNRHYQYSLSSALGRRELSEPAGSTTSAASGSAEPGAASTTGGAADPSQPGSAAKEAAHGDQAGQAQPLDDVKQPNTFVPPSAEHLQHPQPDHHRHDRHGRHRSAADIALGGIPGLKNRLHPGGHDPQPAGGAGQGQNAQQPGGGEVSEGAGHSGGGRHDMPAGRMGLH